MRTSFRELPLLGACALSLAFLGAGCAKNTAPSTGTGQEDGGQTSAGTDCVDSDQDGFGVGAGCQNLDCDDANGSIGDTASASCYGGPDGTAGVGECKAGTKTCAGGVWAACSGEVQPSEEQCDDKDNDCDGAADEALTRSCYSGPSGTDGVGACTAGTQTCTAGVFGACAGEVVPSAEVCDREDNDCNGTPDDIVAKSCYTGAAGTLGVGECKGGTEACVNGALVCVGEVAPTPAEACNNGKDETCNGPADETVGCAVDTYVCSSCAGASDSNPGTASSPLRTLQRGIEYARSLSKPKVFVANQSQTTASTYSEDITMSEGVSVEGRWTPGATWARNSVRTLINNTAASGLKFPAGLTAGTTLDGFWVRNAGGVSGATASAAISITESSPTLVDFQVGPMVAGAPPVQGSLGVSVTGTSANPARPTLKGSAGALSIVNGGVGTATSVGIAATSAELLVDFVQVNGGPSPASTGLYLASSPRTRIQNSLIQGGSAQACTGIFAEGAVEEIRVESNTITGCPGGAGALPVRASGVVFHKCSVAPGAALPLVKSNSSIAGGPSGGANSASVGVAAMDGCPVEISNNTAILGGGGGTAATVVGVLCTDRNLQQSAGSDSACVVKNNAINGGSASSANGAGLGVACAGSCAAKGSSCMGSCLEISGNTVRVESGFNLVHLAVDFSSPLISKNRVGFGASCAAANSAAVGISLHSSASRVENNMVLAGGCDLAFGLAQTNEARADGSFAAPDVHSNTLVGGGGPGRNLSIGAITLTRGTATPGPLGVYRNNIFVGGLSNVRVGFRESDANSDPAKLLNNDFFNFGLAFGSALYQDEGQTPLTSAQAIDALNDANAGIQSNQNRQDAPSFVSASDLHLQPTSALRNLGTQEGMPPDDYDGQVRPNPQGNPPDIGADEIL